MTHTTHAHVKEWQTSMGRDTTLVGTWSTICSHTTCGGYICVYRNKSEWLQFLLVAYWT